MLGPGVVIVAHAHANPPIPGGTGEAQDFGGAIAARQMPRQSGGFVLVVEPADLHCPFAAYLKRGWGFEDFEFYRGHARAPELNFARCGERKINHPAGNKRPAIGDAHQYRLPVSCVGDAHDRAQRQSAVGGGHCVHVVDFAVRAAAVVIGRAIPTGQTGLGREHRGTFWNLRFRQVRRRGLGVAGFWSVLYFVFRDRF